MTPAISEINRAAYALEKSSMALLFASTPNAKTIAKGHYDSACAEMRRLLTAQAKPRKTA